MASENSSVVVPQDVKKEVCEEVKTIANESVPPSGENEALKPKEASPVAPSAESGESIVVKESEGPTFEEQTGVEEIPEAVKTTCPTDSSADSELKAEDENVEPPPIEEVKKHDDTPIVDVSVEDNSVEKEVHEEVKTIEKECASPSEESQVKPKDEDLPSLEATILPESEEKIEEKESGVPSAEDIKQNDGQENPKAEVLPCPTVSSAESEEKFEDKQVEPPPIEEVNKHDDTPVVDASTKENTGSTILAIPQTEIPKVSDEVVINGESQVEEKSHVEKPEEEHKEVEEKSEQAKIDGVCDVSVEDTDKNEKQVPELPIEAAEVTSEEDIKVPEPESKKEVAPEEVPSVEQKTLEQTVALDCESSSEAIEKKEEQVDESPAKAVDVTLEEDVKLPTSDTKTAVACEAIPATAEEKVQPTELTEQIVERSATVEPKEEVETESSTDKVEDAKANDLAKNVEGLAEAEKSITEAKVDESVKCVEQPAIVEPKEEVETESSTDKVEDAKANESVKDVEGLAEAEKSSTESKVDESVKNVVEEQLEQKCVEADIETPAKNVKTEENGEKSVAVEESTQPETATDKGEKAAELDATCRDIGLVAENGSKKDEDVASVENDKNAEVENKIDEDTNVVGPKETPRECEAAEKVVQAGEPESEQEKEADREITDQDIHQPKSIKDVEDINTPLDASKEEVRTKVTQKQSKTILSKVKQSLVKAKKAIIGKSPNTKAAPAEAKVDVQDK